MDSAFKKFASKANGTEATSMDINKWAKDAGVLGKNLTSNHIDIAFSKVKVKGAKYVRLAYAQSLIYMCSVDNTVVTFEIKLGLFKNYFSFRRNHFYSSACKFA